MQYSTPPPGGPAKAVIYTTAPSAYDWWFTTEVTVHVGTAAHGKIVRKVAVEAERVGEQCARYASGCHMVADEAEWKKLVDYKLVTQR